MSPPCRFGVPIPRFLVFVIRRDDDIIPDVSRVLVIEPLFLLLQSNRECLLARLADVQKDIGTVDRMRTVDLIYTIIVVAVHSLHFLQGARAIH